MAVITDKVIVELQAKIDKYNADVLKGQRNFTSAMNSISQGSLKAETAALRSSTAISAAMGLVSVASLKAAQTILDTSTRVENSLRVAGLSGQELKTTYDQLYQSAQRFGVPLEAVSTLYGRLTTSGKELNASQQELMQFTNLVNMSLKVSGQSATEASGALLQLSQALGGGKIQAEEYNSLIDGARPLLQAVAAGLEEAGGSVSKLTRLVKDGKVSSEAFFRAGLAGYSTLEQAASQSSSTIENGFTKIANALVRAAGRFNDATQTSHDLNTALSSLATFIDGVNFENIVNQLNNVGNALDRVLNKLKTDGEDFGGWTGLDQIGVMIENATGLPIATESAKANSRKGYWEKLAEKDIKARNEAYQKVLKDPTMFGPQLPGPLSEADTRKAINGVPFNTLAPGVPGGLVKNTTVSLEDFTLPGDSGGGKGRKSKRGDEWQRETAQIQERTLALREITAAQAGVNPLIDDYGFAVEKAQAKQELLNAAMAANKEITPALEKEIDGLADAYASAVVASEQLQEKQEAIRQAAEEALALGKDTVSGLIDGFIEGADAADILANSLKKIGNALVDDVLNNIFRINSAGSGSGGLLSGIFSLFGGGGFQANTTLGSFLTNGYANGTRSASPGWHWVGEEGPELLKFSGGEQVVPNHGLNQLGARSGGSSSGSLTGLDIRVYMDDDGKLGAIIDQRAGSIADERVRVSEAGEVARLPGNLDAAQTRGMI